MKQLFYWYSPIFLPIIGLVYNLIAYWVIENTPIAGQTVFLMLNFAVQSIVLYICGSFIRKYHSDSRKDFLTGLGNRARFHETLEDQLTQVPLSLIMVDVDNFKEVNDRFGHKTGDVILRELSNVFCSNTRATDCLTRWGGDEFAIILPHTTMESAGKIAERIRDTVEKTYADYQVTISMGIVHIKDKVEDVGLVEKLADEALYEAKLVKNKVITKTSI